MIFYIYQVSSYNTKRMTVNSKTPNPYSGGGFILLWVHGVKINDNESEHSAGNQTNVPHCEKI